MKYPILDLKPEIALLWDEILPVVQDVLRNAHFIMGPNVGAFEKEVASYLGAAHAVGVNSGTDALLIGMRALGIGPGDEVLTTAFSFFATCETVSVLGATPVFVDIDPVTYNLDVAQLEAKITPRTKAILPVHLYGHAADMTAILAVAAKHGLKVIEDVAQAMGGEHQGRKLGTIGDVGAFSFFPSKNLGGCGDGGLIVTNDDALADACRMLRVHGSRQKYINEAIGYNSRLDEIQAAILRVKLGRLDQANEFRRGLAARYAEELAEFPEVTAPVELPGCKHVYHQYTVRVAGSRDTVRSALTDAGVGTLVYYPVALHQLPVYGGTNVPHLPRAEEASRSVFSLPMGPSMNDVDGLMDALREGLRAARGRRARAA